MRQLFCMLLVGAVLAVAPAALAEESFAPDSELAGWLFPAAFSIYSARTVAWDGPAAYFIDTPRVGSDLVSRRMDADTVSGLVRALGDPYLTAKDPIAAELRRRAGQDFGYSDSAPLLKRRQAVSKWASWARKSRQK